MEQRTKIAGMVAGIMAILGYAFYIRDLVANPFRDKSLTGWIIWCIVGFLIFKSYVMVGKSKSAPEQDSATNDSKWVPLIYVIGPPVIIGILYFYCHVTTAHFTWLDWTFLTASILSGVYLWMTQDSLLTLHVNMVIDSTGAAFVACNAWKHHGAENFAAWLCFTLACAVNLFAVKKWEYKNYVYPISVTIMCGTILAFTIFR